MLSLEDSVKAPNHCEINPPRRILVADDDEDIRRIHAHILIDAGYEVDSVTDGAAAWAALQQNHYDLLLTDNNMPKMSGLELIENLQAARIRMPVIMATGAALPTGPNQNLQIEAVLLKPYAADELLARVWTVMHAMENDANLAASFHSAGPGSPPDGLRP